MTLREQFEAREEETLSKYAALSKDAVRHKEEAPCKTRTAFARDRDRIIHSKAFRRLKHKTQVFLSPEGDHYRTRLTHTLEVSQIARTIARALRLNEDLTEAIALGHDLGHTPFGHAGEQALSAVAPFSFHHNEQGVRVAERMEHLNLTTAVLDGIFCHSKSSVRGMAATLEGQIVFYADEIAYSNHDFDDALRAGVLKPDDLPEIIQKTLGKNHNTRINTLVLDIIENSREKDKIELSAAGRESMTVFAAFMTENVYRNKIAKGEEGKARDMLASLYKYLLAHKEELPPEYIEIAKEDGPERAVCDYIACMSDPFAVAAYEERFVPKNWRSI